MQNNTSPLISIITVVYNSKYSIKNTIESITRQQFKDMEYIIIDGGSTDGTIEVIRSYENNIDLIVSEKDFGIYDAMNKGIAKANGEWIIFINSGDLLEIGSLEAVQDTLRNTMCDVLYGDVKIKTAEGIRLDKARSLNLLNYSFSFCHQSVFTRRHLLKGNPFSLAYDICADYDFFLKSYLADYRFHYYPLAISTFEYGGISSGLSRKYIYESIQIIAKRHKSVPKKMKYLFKFLKTLILVK